jgi:hypothetical protein
LTRFATGDLATASRRRHDDVPTGGWRVCVRARVPRHRSRRGGAYDDADLDRAIQAYRFFFPTVSGLAIFRGTLDVGLVANRVFGTMDTTPRQVGFTLNSDTPYGPMMLDLREGPLVIEVPAGPLIWVALDLNQRWVADMGVPGPDAGHGGSHLLLPPGWGGEVPVWSVTTCGARRPTA